MMQRESDFLTGLLGQGTQYTHTNPYQEMPQRHHQD